MSCAAGHNHHYCRRYVYKNDSRYAIVPNCLLQYEFERRKYAQDLINFDKKFSALFSGKPRTEEFQDGVSHAEFLEYVQHKHQNSYFID